MARFNDFNWEKLRKNYELWHKNKLGRPIIPIKVHKETSDRIESPFPLLEFLSAGDLNVTPKQLVDRLDYELSLIEFVGDAYPYIATHAFGAGVAAAFLGCELHARKETTWFTPVKQLPIKELHFEYDPDNIWLRRVKDIYIEGMEKWRGNVVMAMTDLGGVLDILSSFRTPEGLLLDLYDYPDEVLRCVEEIQTLWFRYFDEINDIIKNEAKGFSSWCGVYDTKPTYILQSDFCYMISNEMFNTFVGPELKTSAARLSHPYYHLDGVGELNHLESVLKIDELMGIQWVAGDGPNKEKDWSGVQQRIAQAGKKTFILYEPENIQKLMKLIPGDMMYTTGIDAVPATLPAELETLKRIGIEL